MADHRAENIVVEIVDRLTGLATTGANVFRGRVYDIPEGELPCLCVYQGPDIPRSDGGSSSWQFIDGDLTIYVEAVVKDSAAQVETTLNQIRYELTQALQQDVTQGLSYVLNTTEGVAGVELSGSGDKIVGRMRTEWGFNYRRRRYIPTRTATAELDDSAQEVDAEGTRTPSVTITAVGTGLAYASISQPQGLAGLSSASFAYSDPTSAIDRIERYTVDTGTGAIALSGTDAKATQSINLTNVATNAIGYYYYTGVTGIVRQYAWTGSAWDDSTVTGQATISGSSSAQCCKVANNVMAVSANNADRTYQWNSGSDVYTQLTTTAPGTGSGPRPMAYLQENNVAVFSPNGGGFLLGTYVWNGSTHTLSGNALTVNIAGINSAVGMNSGTRVVAYSPTTRHAYVFDRSGSDWVLITDAAVGSQSASQGLITGLPGTNFFVHVDATDKTFRLYSVT